MRLEAGPRAREEEGEKNVFLSLAMLLLAIRPGRFGGLYFNTGLSVFIHSQIGIYALGKRQDVLKSEV